MGQILHGRLTIYFGVSKLLGMTVLILGSVWNCMSLVSSSNGHFDTGACDVKMIEHNDCVVIGPIKKLFPVPCLQPFPFVASQSSFHSDNQKELKNMGESPPMCGCSFGLIGGMASPWLNIWRYAQYFCILWIPA